jgi:hypothetical protein
VVTAEPTSTSVATTTPTTSHSTAPSHSLSTSPAKPKGPATSFGAGTYLAGRDFVAGTYRSTGPRAGDSFCYWAREHDASGESDATIASDLPQGPAEVTINAGEYFESSNCQIWTRIA